MIYEPMRSAVEHARKVLAESRAAEFSTERRPPEWWWGYLEATLDQVLRAMEPEPQCQVFPPSVDSTIRPE